ncbi:MAG: SDR family oxidoreductase [Dongiaceae bacterium]
MSTSLFDLSGRVAIVTGSGSGLGRAIARGLAAAGAAVAVCGRTEAPLAETVAGIANAGGTACAIPFDARSPESCAALVAATVARFGRLDIMVVNHGVGGAKPPEEVTPEDWAGIIAANLTGAFYCAQAAGRHFIAAKQPGNIVFTSSTGSTRAFAGLSAYGASKGGLDQLCRQLAYEWADHGIRVNAIAPGYMKTHMKGRDEAYQDPAIARLIHDRTPMRRDGAPEELVGPVLFFASDASSFVTGHVMPVDGGWCIL